LKISKQNWVNPAPVVIQSLTEEPKIYTGLILPCPGGIVTRHLDVMNQKKKLRVFNGCAAFPLMSEEHYYKFSGNIGLKLYQYKSGNQTKHFNESRKSLIEMYRSFVEETARLFDTGRYPVASGFPLYMTQAEYVAVRYGLCSWCTDVLLPEPTTALVRMQKILKINNLVLSDVAKFLGKFPKSDRYVIKSRFDPTAFYKVKAPTLDRLFAFLEKKGARVATYQDEQSTEEFKIWTAK